MSSQSVDVALNIFGKPYQTSLSLLSLFRFSEQRIDRVFMQFEPSGSMHDTVSPYCIAEYVTETIGPRCVVYQPRYWLKFDVVDESRLQDPEYLYSIRYQHGFTHTDKKYLFVMHNDVYFKRDVIGPMLEKINGAFAVGRLGQCWACPAREGTTVREAGLGNTPCDPTRYMEFRPDFTGLDSLYRTAARLGVFGRPYWKGWAGFDRERAWPLPECRINEWACLVDVEQTRPHVYPNGPVLPFGAFEQCGETCLDTAVAWFRGLHHRGLFARHMDIDPYLKHWVGTGKIAAAPYLRAEATAKALLEKYFQPFVEWCRKKNNGMFS